MKRTITILWNNDCFLEVTGTYYKCAPMSADRIVPPEASDFDVKKIEYKGLDVILLFSDEDYFEIINRCLTLIEN